MSDTHRDVSSTRNKIIDARVHKKATASEALNPGFVSSDLIQRLPSEITVVDHMIEESTP